MALPICSKADLAALQSAGLLPRRVRYLKVVGPSVRADKDAKLGKLTVEAAAVTAAAEKAITAAGGTVKLVPRPTRGAPAETTSDQAPDKPTEKTSAKASSKTPAKSSTQSAKATKPKKANS